MDLKDALKETIKRNGKEVLSATNLLKSYLMDLAPDQAKDIQILTDASRHHFFDGIARCDENSLPGALAEFRKSASSLFILPVVESIEEMFKYVLDMEENAGPDKQEEEIHKDKPAFSISNGVLLGYGGTSAIVQIPPEVRSVSAKAFRDSPEIQEVIIPEGVAEIKANTFLDCKKLRKVVLPSTLKTIEDNAFKGCRSLEDIVLPVSVRTIRKDAFRDAGKLEYSRLFADCAAADISLDIADSNLAEEYRKLKPVKGNQENPEKKRFNKKLLLLLVIPAALLFFVRPSTPASRTIPVPTSPALSNETSEAGEELTRAEDEIAELFLSGSYEEGVDRLYELKDNLDPASVSLNFPIILRYDDVSDGFCAGLYKTSGNEYAFYLGEYNNNLEREDSFAYYICTDEDLRDYHSYYYGRWENDKPNDYQIQYFIRYEGSEKVEDYEFFCDVAGGIFDGWLVISDHITNKEYNGWFDDGIVRIQGTVTDQFGNEHKVIAYTKDSEDYYYFPDEAEYYKIYGVEGTY